MEKQNGSDSRSQEMFSKVEAYFSTDLTQQQFCDRERIVKSTFQYWLRKYRNLHNQNIAAFGDFIPVQWSSVNTRQSISANCEIEVPGRMVIRFHSASLTSPLVNLICSLVD